MNIYSILHWISTSSYGTLETRDKDDIDPIEPEYIDKLFEYRKILGVVSVKKDNKIITWELNGCWYSTEQVDRMMKLKAFT